MTLAKPITVQEGSVVSVAKVFIDSQGSTDGQVYVDRNITLVLSNLVYVTNNECGSTAQ